MAEIITGLHAVTLHIHDIHKARAFYREVLGLPEISFSAATNRAVFGLPGTTALLTMHVQAPGEGGREPGTVSGVVFQNPDPRAACAEIARRGGTITVEPHDAEYAGRKFVRAVFADPDGNEFLISNRTD
jgi:catechol 2,3-dioxygenase-like lactoylglutathione lyase family enzyme